MPNKGMGVGDIYIDVKSNEAFQWNGEKGYQIPRVQASDGSLMYTPGHGLFTLHPFQHWDHLSSVLDLGLLDDEALEKLALALSEGQIEITDKCVIVSAAIIESAGEPCRVYLAVPKAPLAGYDDRALRMHFRNNIRNIRFYGFRRLVDYLHGIRLGNPGGSFIKTLHDLYLCPNPREFRKQPVPQATNTINPPPSEAPTVAASLGSEPGINQP
jgi:hypothetical protein